MDERERPPYLGDLPRDRRGNWPMYLLAIGLLAALIGAWKIYTGTVAAWHERFQAPRPKAPASAPPAANIEAQRAEYMRRIRAQREKAARAASMVDERLRAANEQDRSGWKCIDGTPFRPLPGGGWENIPGERCVSPRR